ncbi:terminase small subunit-like protein [Legionella septentrionalis]|uniref:Terminase n=1 Tax=Legionella septentrionalis TaxID=2498109 RepID=A0A3S1CL08_9GAMM|nr:hypothetical protein [Legionella septentrionalis]RUQ85043.1 hypothetical protein EKM59_07860 [Legionella septentrionalis]
MAEKKMKRGRPTGYTSELAKEICEVIASTSKGTKKLCEENQHWPCQDTLFTWLKAYPEFSEQYAEAKKCQIEFFIDEILEISDDVSQDQFIDEQGKIVFNSQSIHRARLRIDTRKWLACKLVPRVYGPKPPEESFVDPKLKQDIWERWAKLDEKNRKEY